MTYAKITLVGNLGQEPQLRYLANGQAVCNLSVATNEKWKDGEGESQERTTWWRVSVWGKQAEACSQYLDKGRQVLVEGRMNADESGNPRIYEKNDGTTGASFELTARTVHFLGRNENDSGSSTDSMTVANNSGVPQSTATVSATTPKETPSNAAPVMTERDLPF
jgi:single-strand DNA-binding protein|tara:strand:+ start:1438 stop:1932 length:495 start_codon:yes stop_codon:yes gene_type:complete